MKEIDYKIKASWGVLNKINSKKPTRKNIKIKLSKVIHKKQMFHQKNRRTEESVMIYPNWRKP